MDVSGHYSHMDWGIMDGRWRGGDDDDGDDLLRIPVPAGCRTELLIPEIEIASAAERRCVSRNMVDPPSIFRSRGLSSPKGRVGGCPRCPHPSWARAHPDRKSVV